MRRRYNLGVPKFRTPLTMRLEREQKELQAVKQDSTILEIHAAGDPPDVYHFIFHGKSLVPADNEDGVAIGDLQECEIKLGAGFPRTRPEVHWLSPIVHPNISGGGVCMGNFAANWNPNFTLSMLVEVLWDMARMAIFNPHSAYGREARMTWEQMDRKFHFPVDRRPLRDKILPNDAPSSIIRDQVDSPADVTIINDDEGGCQFLE
jgi:ubiquitin-protein ligase